MVSSMLCSLGGTNNASIPPQNIGTLLPAGETIYITTGGSWGVLVYVEPTNEFKNNGG